MVAQDPVRHYVYSSPLRLRERIVRFPDLLASEALEALLAGEYFVKAMERDLKLNVPSLRYLYCCRSTTFHFRQFILAFHRSFRHPVVAHLTL
jgi:hypothetical protein